MKPTFFSRFAVPFVLLLLPVIVRAAEPDAEALLYSTMPSTSAHRPEMAMDGDEKTYFKSFYGMGDKDDFQILLSRPIPLRSLRIVTGDGEKQNFAGVFVHQITDFFFASGGAGSEFV